MIRGRKPSQKSKFYVPYPIWCDAISFCRCYPLWVAELSVCDTSKTITDYENQIHVQTSGDYNPVEEMAFRRLKLQKRIDIVRNAAEKVTDNPVMLKYLIMGVTQHLSYDTLNKQGIPCGRRMYHEYRREMIFNVSQAIG